MKLFGVEVRRLLCRRLFLTALVLLALVIGGVLAKTAYDSHAPTPAQIAAAQQQVGQLQGDIARERASCQREEKRTGRDLGCDQIRRPRPEELLGDRIFRFAPAAKGLALGFSVFLTLIGFLLGSTYVGAEWSAGTMAALLLWQPRRLAVVAAKAGALAAVLGAVGALAMGAWLAGHYLVAQVRGDTGGVTGSFLRSLALVGLRSVALMIFAGLLGLGVAGTLRFTAAALGLAFAYSLGAEGLLRTVWHGSDRWLLSSNVGAWLNYGVDIPRFNCSDTTGECTEGSIRISFEQGTLYLTVGLLAVLALFALTFSRRDVT